MSAFGEILIYIIGGLAFIIGGLFTAWLIRPSRPNIEKLTTYESGEHPIGTARGRINIRFYIIALIFLLFEVEIVFLFPWATVFGNKELINETQGLWGWFSLAEMAVFIFILSLGLAYVWAKGHLEWPKPAQHRNDYTSPVPKEMYDKINSKYD
jgi:NADH-quinone oxidoreductase subunit A